MEQLERPPYLRAYTGSLLTDIKIHYLRQWRKELKEAEEALEQLSDTLKALWTARIDVWDSGTNSSRNESQAYSRVETEYNCLCFQRIDLSDKYVRLYRSLMENLDVGGYVSLRGISAALEAPDREEETFAEWQRKSVSH